MKRRSLRAVGPLAAATFLASAAPGPAPPTDWLPSDSPRADSPLPRVAEDAPEFRLTDTYGDKVRLSDYRGKIVALHFWAKWCASCRLDLQYFQGAAERYGPDGVVVLGLAYASGDRESVGAFAESLGVTFPILMANEEVLDAYGVATFPSNVMIDREGKIRHVAYRLMNASYWEEIIQGLIAESEP